MSSKTATNKPARPLESLSDRLDAILLGFAFAMAAYFYVDQAEFAKAFDSSKAPFLQTYNWECPLVALPLYLILVLIIEPRTKNGSGNLFGLPDGLLVPILKLWNLGLALLSVSMLVGMAIPQAFFLLSQNSLFDAFHNFLCDDGSNASMRWSGPGWFWMFLFTMSKYAELFDTVLLVVRRKPVSFLHWYHHTSVLAYTWFGVGVQFGPGWTFAIVNSAVHSIMYFYYYRAACGVKLTYDRLITTIQITQMIIGMIATSVWAYFHYVSEGGLTACPCKEAEWAMISGLLMYGSYFVLFLSFYLKRYQKKTVKSA